MPNNPFGGLDLILELTTSDPELLKPNLLIKASSSSSRNTLGFGFPYCLFGVIVPTSTNPKPNLNNELYTSASLSKPAAIPIGLGIFLLKIFISRELCFLMLLIGK